MRLYDVLFDSQCGVVGDTPPVWSREEYQYGSYFHCFALLPGCPSLVGNCCYISQLLLSPISKISNFTLQSRELLVYRCLHWLVCLCYCVISLQNWRHRGSSRSATPLFFKVKWLISPVESGWEREGKRWRLFLVGKVKPFNQTSNNWNYTFKGRREQNQHYSAAEALYYWVIVIFSK